MVGSNRTRCKSHAAPSPSRSEPGICPRLRFTRRRECYSQPGVYRRLCSAECVIRVAPGFSIPLPGRSGGPSWLPHSLSRRTSSRTCLPAYAKRPGSAMTGISGSIRAPVSGRGEFRKGRSLEMTMQAKDYYLGQNQTLKGKALPLPGMQYAVLNTNLSLITKGLIHV